MNKNKGNRKFLKYKKIKPKKKTKWIKSFFFFFLITSIAFIVFGSQIFWTGYHNLDSCQNSRYLSAKLNLTLYEMNTDGSTISLEDCYLLGINQLIKGHYLSLYASFLVGFVICIFYISFNPKEKKWE